MFCLIIKIKELYFQDFPNTLFSSANPFNKLHFPKESVGDDTRIKLQVLLFIQSFLAVEIGTFVIKKIIKMLCSRS